MIRLSDLDKPIFWTNGRGDEDNLHPKRPIVLVTEDPIYIIFELRSVWPRWPSEFVIPMIIVWWWALCVVQYFWTAPHHIDIIAFYQFIITNLGVKALKSSLGWPHSLDLGGWSNLGILHVITFTVPFWVQLLPFRFNHRQCFRPVLASQTLPCISSRPVNI